MMYKIPPKMKKEAELFIGISVLSVVKILIFGIIGYTINSILPENLKFYMNMTLLGIIAMMFISLMPDPEMGIKIKDWIMYWIRFSIREKTYMKKGAFNELEIELEEEEDSGEI